jgi:hypothetical protein
MFPEPDCDSGYSFDLLEEVLGDARFAELMDWMRGQTLMLCDGRRYDHDTQEYYETGHAHGPVVYTWDVQNFLRGGPILD